MGSFSYAESGENPAGYVLSDPAARDFAQSGQGTLHIGEHCIGRHSSLQASLNGGQSLLRPSGRFDLPGVGEQFALLFRAGGKTAGDLRLQSV